MRSNYGSDLFLNKYIGKVPLVLVYLLPLILPVCVICLPFFCTTGIFLLISKSYFYTGHWPSSVAQW